MFAGTPGPALPTLRALIDGGQNVVAVISRPPAPAGRGRTLAASPVAEAATAAGLPLLTPVSARDPEFVAALRALDPELGVVVAYGQLLRRDVLDIPALGWVNLHFSLLPAWRGAAPVAAAIRAGDDLTGASAFRLEAGMDTGPVYGVITEPIGPRDTAGALLARLAVAGATLVARVVAGLADGTARARPQPADGVSSAPKLTAADAEIDFTAPAAAVERQIRAVTPDPGAWAESPWGRLTLGPAAPVDTAGKPADAPQLAPGELAVQRRRALVGTGTAPLQLGEVRPPGRRWMPATDWARGVRPEPGTRLGRR